jgi:TonB family protein
MQANYSPQLTHFGLLPEPEGRSVSFLTSMVVNSTMLALALIVSMTAKHVIDENKYEQTELIIPQNPPPEKVKLTEPPKLPDPPKPPDVKLEAPKIEMPKPEPKPDLKPIQMEAKVTLPVIKEQKLTVVEAPQPKVALASAPPPALVPQAKPSMAAVHFGSLQGVMPNPNAKGPATIAAIGNPYGGMSGPVGAPHGVVGSTGIGGGTRIAQNVGVAGKVASVGIPSVAAPVAAQQAYVKPVSTELEVLSKPAVQYTPEARQLRIQGEVILRVTFTATGQVLVQSVVHGLGHGLDEEARRVAQQIRFRPATRDGKAVDMTTNITITFQLA